MYYKKDTQWFGIEFNSVSKDIAVREKWKYNWIDSLGMAIWTYKEKKAFHHNLDNLLWGKWGAHFKLKVRGSSDFAKTNAFNTFSVYFDITWVLDSGHWTVDVTKMPFSAASVSHINWGNRTVFLHAMDINIGSNGYKQHVALHEFGHTIGNSVNSFPGMHGDEYKNTSTFYYDKASLMNIGDELRTRHVDFLLQQLNGVSPLIPNTEFYVL